ncbi:MAG: glucokinase [Deltaproteobacteria bacterium]|jgi:glucokinase|nr:glucokinase [Deltaproteobacteria bacterium]
MNAPHLLAADIGGTNSRFALFRLEPVSPQMENASVSSGAISSLASSNALIPADTVDAPAATNAVTIGQFRLSLVPGSKLMLSTPDHGNFGQLLNSLREAKSPGGFSLLDEGFNLIGASLAVPGPVRDDVCQAPNIHWPLGAQDACAALDCKTLLLNDFAAQGLACLFPAVQGLRPVLPGQPQRASPKIILGAGTGLGKAIILPGSASFCRDAASDIVFASGRVGEDYTPVGKNSPALPDDKSRHYPTNCKLRDHHDLSARILPSEGGHSLFPFRGEEEAAFEAFLRKVSGRREVIGDMVVTGYGLAALYAFHSEKQKLLPPPEVTPRLAGCPAALEWLARFYGRACRNMLLETLALGGVVLSGGMISHVPGLLGHPAFEAEFRSCETQAHLLSQVPVWWASNPDCGLWGAAIHGLEHFLQR